MNRNVGAYAIGERLGAGGMGEVYRARDTKLGRDVAIKVLAPQLAADADAVARLEREARVLATLNHPSIATIFGLETLDGKPALVLELVEGPTLADRLAGGALPLVEALAVAKQIAEAIEAAHESGVIHRDLKPANIKLTADGRVKVLDFGLAKTLERGAPDRSVASTMMATEAGRALVIGTPAYMSPEQARGDAADRSSDAWAFGCVVFEMLAGSPAFSGPTATDVIAAVLRADPSWETLPDETPLPLALLLRRCLQKDAKRRLQSIADARIEIDQLLTDPVAASASARLAALSARRAPRWLLPAVSSAVIVAAAAVPASRWLRTVPPAAEVRFQIPTPTNGLVKISPDGQSIAFVVAQQGGGRGGEIWVRPLNSLDAHLVVPASEGAGGFAWSKDSRSIVFTTRGAGVSESKLKRVDAAGGPIRTVGGSPSVPIPPALNTEGVAVFAGASGDGTLSRVSVSGGDSIAITRLDPSLGEHSHLWPSFLPDGRHFLYIVWSNAREKSTGAIYVGSLDPNEPRTRLMDTESMALYAPPGYLLFSANMTLMARPFDASHLRFTGDPVVVADNVAAVGTGMMPVDVSDTGTLIYRSRNPQRQPFAWKDRAGSIAGTPCAIPLTNKTGWRLSPDGKRVAVFSESTVDLWLCDLERDQSLQFTKDPYFDREPIWSPDGSRIVYQSFRSASNADSGLYEKAANGASADRVLLPAEAGTNVQPLDWSGDGNWILFSKQKGREGETREARNRDVWMLPLNGDRIPRPYLASAFDEPQAAFSPDGRFVAYSTNEVSGDYEVVVQPFPDPSGGKWRISTDGGCCARWKRDGSELYYVDNQNRVRVVPVRTAPSFDAGRPASLDVTLAAADGLRGSLRYDVAADGQRFLVDGAGLKPSDEDTRSAITVVLNWASTFTVKR